jgi:cell division topological specificity factor
MGFLEKLFSGSSNKSSSVAKKRLQLVLLQDRIKLPPPVMEEMRDEIIAVISKYVDIDKEGIDITLTQVSDQNCLVANIPVLRTKHLAQ